MTTVTIYALFGDDIRNLWFTKKADNVFYSLTTLSFASFSIELILCCIAKEGYFLGFYFWLDLVSTLSLIMDIGWIMNGGRDKSTSSAKKASSLARAGRGARIGTKAGRVTRVIRLIRLIRIVKLYKNANSVLGKDDTGLIDENQIQPIPQDGVPNKQSISTNIINGPTLAADNQEKEGLIAPSTLQVKAPET
jgi:hypothetical protein